MIDLARYISAKTTTKKCSLCGKPISKRIKLENLCKECFEEVSSGKDIQSK